MQTRFPMVFGIDNLGGFFAVIVSPNTKQVGGPPRINTWKVVFTIRGHCYPLWRGRARAPALAFAPAAVASLAPAPALAVAIAFAPLWLSLPLLLLLCSCWCSRFCSCSCSCSNSCSCSCCALRVFGASKPFLPLIQNRF